MSFDQKFLRQIDRFCSYFSSSHKTEIYWFENRILLKIQIQQKKLETFQFPFMDDSFIFQKENESRNHMQSSPAKS